MTYCLSYLHLEYERGHGCHIFLKVEFYIINIKDDDDVYV